jgi:hypothetical protein
MPFQFFKKVKDISNSAPFVEYIAVYLPVFVAVKIVNHCFPSLNKLLKRRKTSAFNSISVQM